MTVVREEEHELVAALRRGDEDAYMRLVEELSPGMRRVALQFVRTRAVADEVVQEAWLGVLRGIDRFEGRSSLRTWIYRILTNVAKTRAQREARSTPFSSLAGEVAADDPAVEPDRFLNERFPDGWTTFPEPWEPLLAGEARAVIAAAIEALPPAQRLVISLRDVEGLSAEEACNVLAVSETNQRVLLHRARSKVRAALERYHAQDAT